MHTPMTRVALVVMLLSTSAAAALADAPSPLALPTLASDPTVLGVEIRPAQEPAREPSFAERTTNGLTTLAAVVSPYLPRVENAGVRYRPRSSGYRRGNDSYGVSQLHVGYFDPEGDLGERFLIGLRGGPMIDPNIQLGLGLDWAHKTEKSSSVTSTQEGPGGIPIVVRQDLARASTNLFPIMAFLQVSAKDDMPIVPYFGIGGGYQVMVLSAEDFTTGEEFDGTFGGWGWQAWGGAALPLSGRTRLTGELYVNGAELSRDVEDPFTGADIRESIDADGMGLRIGLAWGF